LYDLYLFEGDENVLLPLVVVEVLASAKNILD
jgi:hypothetical protein